MNRIKNDLSGMIFGYLEVIKPTDSKVRGNQKRVVYKCKCLKCGNIVDVYADCLTSKVTTSCGCLRKDMGMTDKIRQEFISGTQISKIKSRLFTSLLT